MKQSTKIIVYEALAAALMLWAALRCAALGSADLLAAEGGLRAAEMTLLVLGCIVLGVSVYGGRSFARRQKDLRADVWFGVAAGAALMIGWFVLFWGYGGLTAVTDTAGVRARNTAIIAMTLLPLPFLIRGAVLAFFSKDERRARRVTLCVIAGVCLLVYAGLILSGVLLNTLPVPAKLP